MALSSGGLIATFDQAGTAVMSEQVVLGLVALGAIALINLIAVIRRSRQR